MLVFGARKQLSEGRFAAKLAGLTRWWLKRLRRRGGEARRPEDARGYPLLLKPMEQKREQLTGLEVQMRQPVLDRGIEMLSHVPETMSFRQKMPFGGTRDAVEMLGRRLLRQIGQRIKLRQTATK